MNIFSPHFPFWANFHLEINNSSLREPSGSCLRAAATSTRLPYCATACVVVFLARFQLLHRHFLFYTARKK